ncbi:hypothetical protein GCK72_003289 [Caenorhabditis remanei]|uniref:Uncharacterized protein n=1 Tax=Caenorhabditis remanei TaxID=31234 RepID=A0A6A5HXZ9_CAERE|nr:hypothetical protein GCK72_003289 [Caenorhabditis remanei]KAF1771463.1 hypothetical protein GCK72_003289 [Caenorhabditis remanei]
MRCFLVILTPGCGAFTTPTLKANDGFSAVVVGEAGPDVGGVRKDGGGTDVSMRSGTATLNPGFGALATPMLNAKDGFSAVSDGEAGPDVGGVRNEGGGTDVSMKTGRRKEGGGMEVSMKNGGDESELAAESCGLLESRGSFSAVFRGKISSASLQSSLLPKHFQVFSSTSSGSSGKSTSLITLLCFLFTNNENLSASMKKSRLMSLFSSLIDRN